MLLSQYTHQNTLGIAGISNQLCHEAVKMGFLESISSSTVTCDADSLVHLYLHPQAAAGLRQVSELHPVVVSTCYRTLAQQYILKQNLTSLVANVGRSDHGSGKSIDLTNWQELTDVLPNYGFSQSYGNRDAVHWDFNDVPDSRSNTVLAFQKLWNRNNPRKLAEDGIVGGGTLSALSNTPVNGFINSDCPRYLSFHDEGKDVGALQFALRKLGILNGACDGLFGNQTQAAVIQFQLKSGLIPTGIVDNCTLSHLQPV
jgi:N-acetylmuramoyl-L-alanine amidase